MAETIEKLLQQGFEFHQLGQAEFAYQIYKAILLAEPNHPEASYNMGLLAVSAGQIEAGLTFLETALEANADNAIYWVSYIDVLLEIGRTEDAQAVFDQAKFNGAKGEGFDKLEQRLTDGRKETLTANSPGLEEKHPKQPNILNSLKLDQAINLAKKKAKEGAPEEAKRIFEDILTKFPKNKRASDGLKGLAGRPVGKLSTVQEPPQAQTQALINLYSQGQLQRALQEAETLAQKFPQSAILLNIKGAVLRDLGQFDASVEAYNKSLAIKPDYASAQHMVSSLTGKTTTSTPKQYVESLFDGYAKKFEQSLVENLEYKIPKMLTDIVVKENGGGLLGSVLDLGCGTGLMGVEIKDYCSNLEGIDLSEKMLGLADAKKVYDKLIHTDILHYLADTDLCFDYFIATDVLIYVGDLTELFRLIKSRNKRKGKLVFSTEHTELDGFQLEKTGRYSHSKTYIEELCAKFKYTISHFSMVNLRKDKGQFLTGGLYILDF